MRVYFEKPRTTVGWKGLINDPLPMEALISMLIGQAQAYCVKLLKWGPAGTDLDPITPQFIADLVSGSDWRTYHREQVHRELASGLSMPVGFKNGTGGSTNWVDAVNVQASAPVPFSYRAWLPSSLPEAIRLSRFARGLGRSKLQPRAHWCGDRQVESVGLSPRVMVIVATLILVKTQRSSLRLRNHCEQIATSRKGVAGVMIESFLLAVVRTIHQCELVYVRVSPWVPA